MGVFSIKVLPKPQRSQTNQSQTHSSTTPGPSLPPTTTVSNPIHVINVRDYSAIDQLGTETGFDGRDNLWLSYMSYMRYTAKTLKRKDCIVCGHARPVLATHPFAIGEGEGCLCILRSFYQDKPNSTLCSSLSLVFPTISPHRAPWGVKAYGGKYSCITGTGSGMDYGRLPEADCSSNITINATWPVAGLNQTSGLADVWWICGPKRVLRPILRGDWQGTCALTSLIIPLTIVDVTAEQLLGSVSRGPENIPSHGRHRRSAPWTEDVVDIHNNLLGVPVGVPHEFQALGRNDGLWHLLPIIGPAIVDARQTAWINYIYDNQQRFVNYSPDALTGMSEQLEATSRVARQNRLALDMLLASQRGVCKMFGEQCCTFIPNNTSPDGSISKALSGLDALSAEMRTMAGVEESGLFSWLGAWFGKYTGMVVTGFLTLILVFLLLMCCAACIIPCFKKSVTDVVKASGMMPLLDAPVGDADTESSFQGRMGLTEDDPCYND
uniref:Envelope protein n=1 Tax=Oncorhynchus tshawytscha TaxID=74940 RepID=A0A8C8MIL9_ONCTS